MATSDDYTPNWHHEIIGKELEHIANYGDRDYKILIVTVPPRHGKSQQCSIDFPAWFLGKFPKEEIIIASYSADLAQGFGAKTREKLSSPLFTQIFDGVSLKEDEKAKGNWKTKQGGGYTSTGVGGAMTGKGAKIVLIDDPVKNREEAESQVFQQKTWDWFTSTAFTRLAPNGVVVLIMTRWNLYDLAGKILAHPTLSERTKLIRFAAISHKDGHYRKAGEALWPKQYSLEALKEIKDAIGPYDWQALYQGDPVLTENQEFKPGWIRRTTEQAVSMMNCRRFLTVDTAMSKKTQADYTGFCDNRVNKENFWHLKAWGAKLSPDELVDAIFTLHETNNYERIGIEKTTYMWGLKPYFDAEQRKRNKFLPIVELSHNQSAKEIRIRGLIKYYASNSVFHIDGQCAMLEDQMVTFPVGIHDDVIDAVSYMPQLTQEEANTNVYVTIPKDF